MEFASYFCKSSRLDFLNQNEPLKHKTNICKIRKEEIYDESCHGKGLELWTKNPCLNDKNDKGDPKIKPACICITGLFLMVLRQQMSSLHDIGFYACQLII